MVFVYHFLYSPHSSLASKANTFFKDLEKGNYIGTISSFTITEFLAVVKRILCNKRDKAVSENDVRVIRESLDKFIAQMGIALYDADTLVAGTTVFSDCEDIVESAVPYKGKRNRKWHYVSGADALHVALAIAVKAELYATFDDDFRGVKEWINPFMLSEVY